MKAQSLVARSSHHGGSEEDICIAPIPLRDKSSQGYPEKQRYPASTYVGSTEYT